MKTVSFARVNDCSGVLDRGRAVHSDQRLGMDYWVERNFNTDTDTSIHRLDRLSAPLRQSLMADPDLAALHNAAVAWRQKRFLILMEQEPLRALFARLLMTPPSRTVSAQSARTLTSFANRGRQKQEQ